MNQELASQLTHKYGSPLYVYHEQAIIKNINDFVATFDVPQLQVCYAMKANSNMSILKLMQVNNIDIDCVSIGEMKTALKVGFDSSRIRFTPTFAGEEEMRFAIQQNISISIDSMQWIEWMLEHFPHYKIGLRINPGVLAGAYLKISTGHSKAKFGIGLQYIDKIISLINEQGLKVNGLHIHSGSDILEAEQFLEAVRVLFAHGIKFSNLEYIDLGSGFKVSYFEGDKSTNMQILGSAISAYFNSFCSDYGKPLKLIFEPGKILVSNSGEFLVTVTGLKENGGIHFSGVDSGFNHLIRPMFYNAYHTIKNITNPNGNLHDYEIVGNICETDTFASNRSLPEIRVGDILSFENAGAYCFSMASSYNSRPKPAEVLIKSNHTDLLIRKRETIEDLWASQIID